MFGVDNVGVINQRNAPAIWESSVANFPANFVKGRILIDNVYGGIYLDTTTTRIQIQAANNGNVTFLNGLTSYAPSPTSTEISLGGDLNYSTQINLNGNEILFEAANNNVQIDSDGNLKNVAQGAYYFWGNVVSASVVIQDATIIFRDEQYNRYIKVAAQII
jgi:hypothetical protein